MKAATLVVGEQIVVLDAWILEELARLALAAVRAGETIPPRIDQLLQLLSATSGQGESGADRRVDRTPLTEDGGARLEEPMLSRREAASRLGVSIRTLDRLTSEGLLASVKLGGRRLYRPETLEEV